MKTKQQEQNEWLEKRLDFLMSELSHKMDKLSEKDFDSLSAEIEELNNEVNWKGLK